MPTYRVDFAKQVDVHTDALMVIGRLVTMNFLGKLFTFSHPFSLDTAGTREFLLTSTANSAHFHVFFGSHAGDQYEVDIYKDTTKEYVSGNAITGSCRNLIENCTCPMRICHTPTGSGDGTLIYENHWGSASKKAQSGGALLESEHWIVDSGDSLLFRMTSRADANVMGLTVHVVEHHDTENTFYSLPVD